MARICEIEGCGATHYAHGLCAKHYQQARAKGLLDGFECCAVNGCLGTAVCKSYCIMHYMRFRKHGSPHVRLKGGTRKQTSQVPCAAYGCGRTMVAKGFCHRHYLLALRNGELHYTPCAVDECEKPATVLGMCNMHAIRFQKYGDVHMVKLVRHPSVERRRRQATERMRRYRATPHGIVRDRWARGKQRTATGWITPGVTKAQLLTLWSQQVCGLCGEKIVDAEKTIDHIVPLAKGGVHALENLQVAHRLCNQRKRDRILDANEFRALYPSYP